MKKGATGNNVKNLQYKLSKLIGKPKIIDGEFGANTESAVKLFQFENGLAVDGYAGIKTLALIDKVYNKTYSKMKHLLHFGKKRFVVFVDAGHGGIDDNGKYVTPGKRAYHKNSELHSKGHYYEGLENRIVAEQFIEECANNGIMCIRVYHPTKDTRISERTKIIRDYLNRGYYGFMLSFHSNAISTRNKAKKVIDSTVGYMVFTTPGLSFSDEIASVHWHNVQKEIGSDKWNFRKQEAKDLDPDFEANFQILRETDKEEFYWFGAILDEWGFHTSETDCNFIVSQASRASRVKASFKTALWVKNNLEKIMLL
jgi:N-acetylmuramoyl-L-alanine amidase